MNRPFPVSPLLVCLATSLLVAIFSGSTSAQEDALVGEARFLMALLDLNDDGFLDRSELEGDAQHLLHDLDQDGDGRVSRGELASLVEPTIDVHRRLSEIETHENPWRLVPLPEGIHEGLIRWFRVYTNVLAPDGEPIHILAMDGWSEHRICRVRKVLEHFLRDTEAPEWGPKTELAKAMAARHATLLLLNDSDDMDRVLPDLEGLNLHFQDLRANEAPYEGEADYMKHETRDAAFEEVFHLIHATGLLEVMKPLDREIRELAKAAREKGLWEFDEPEMPGAHFEYIISVIDNYLDLWSTKPSKMEGHSLPRQAQGKSFMGEYGADSRLTTAKNDPDGLRTLESFHPRHIAYVAELAPEFEGTFSLSSDSSLRYTDKSKHLSHVTLHGENSGSLIGNERDNRLVGNDGDNQLQGLGGDDSLFGGDGIDTALFRGTRDQYTIRHRSGFIEVLDSMVNRDGYDVLVGIEHLEFIGEKNRDQESLPEPKKEENQEAQPSVPGEESAMTPLFDVLDTNRDQNLDPFEALDSLLTLTEHHESLGLTSAKFASILEEKRHAEEAEWLGLLEEFEGDEGQRICLTDVPGSFAMMLESADENGDGYLSASEFFRWQAYEPLLMDEEAIEEEVEQMMEAFDRNRDGLIEESEAPADEWNLIQESDRDANAKVSRREFELFLRADNTEVTFQVEGDTALMNGVIGPSTPGRVLRLLFENPSLERIVMQSVPGSIDDEANLRAASYVRQRGLETVLMAESRIASGGTDFFLAGATRIVEGGAKIGIHSWGGDGVEGRDVPRDHPHHRLYLDYYQKMGIPPSFYWRTLEAAPASGIHWMTEDEVERFGFRRTD